MGDDADGREGRGACKTVVVWFARILRLFVVLCLLANIAAYVVIIQAGARSSSLATLDKVFLILGRLGMLLLCLILLVAEFEPLWFLRHVAVLQFWAVRGFWLGWLGVMTVDTSLTLASALPVASSSKGVIKITGQVVGWTMIGLGALYAVLSLLCIRKVIGETRGFTVVPVDVAGEGALEESLVVVGGGGGGGSAEAKERLKAAALLQANLSLALGLLPDDAARRFKGKDGAKAGSKHAEAAKRELENLRRQVAELKAQRGGGGGGGGGGGSSAAAAATGRGAGDQMADLPAPAGGSVSTSVAVPDERSKYDGEDDGGGRRRGADDDDDALLSMYYKNANFEH